MKRFCLLLTVLLLLMSFAALAESVEQIWVEDVTGPVYAAGDGVCLCLRSASGHLFLRVMREDALLLDTDCGSREGVFISEPYYFAEPGEYLFTLESGEGSFMVRVIAGSQPCPTEYAWLGD